MIVLSWLRIPHRMSSCALRLLGDLSCSGSLGSSLEVGGGRLHIWQVVSQSQGQHTETRIHTRMCTHFFNAIFVQTSHWLSRGKPDLNDTILTTIRQNPKTFSRAFFFTSSLFTFTIKCIKLLGLARIYSHAHHHTGKHTMMWICNISTPTNTTSKILESSSGNQYVGKRMLTVISSSMLFPQRRNHLPQFAQNPLCFSDTVLFATRVKWLLTSLAFVQLSRSISQRPEYWIDKMGQTEGKMPRALGVTVTHYHANRVITYCLLVLEWKVVWLPNGCLIQTVMTNH